MASPSECIDRRLCISRYVEHARDSLSQSVRITSQFQQRMDPKSDGHMHVEFAESTATVRQPETRAGPGCGSDSEMSHYAMPALGCQRRMASLMEQVAY